MFSHRLSAGMSCRENMTVNGSQEPVVFNSSFRRSRRGQQSSLGRYSPPGASGAGKVGKPASPIFSPSRRLPTAKTTLEKCQLCGTSEALKPKLNPEYLPPSTIA
jgi:hypothetical protein